MGDPRRKKKKYTTPLHPWSKEKIGSERVLVDEYGLKNKKEVWRAESLLRNFKNQAKKLIGGAGKQVEKEEEQLISRIIRLNLLQKGAKLDDVLGLDIKDILERRLQSMVYRGNLARSISQARQFIIHGHIIVNERKIDVPSYLVLADEENKIGFSPRSSISIIDHPERLKVEEIEEAEKLKAKRKGDVKEKKTVKRRAKVKEGKPKKRVKKSGKTDKKK